MQSLIDLDRSTDIVRDFTNFRYVNMIFETKFTLTQVTTQHGLRLRNSYLLQVELQWSLAFPWGHTTLDKRIVFIGTKLAYPCALSRLSHWKSFVFRFMAIHPHFNMPVAALINKEPMNFSPSLTAAKTWTGPMIIGGDLTGHWTISLFGHCCSIMDGPRADHFHRFHLVSSPNIPETKFCRSSYRFFSSWLCAPLP